MPDRFQISNVKDKAENPGLETLVTGLSEIAPSSLQPDYDEAELGWLLRQANRVKHAGVLQKVAVRNVKQELQGWFIYYLQPNGESKVLQLVARRNTLDEVFDYLCQHALQGGAISLGGRVEPKHLPMLAAHHCFFTSGTPWFQVHSRNRDLLQAILCGDALLTKLDGEWCTSFRGE